MSAKRMTATAVVLVCAGVLAGLTPGEARGQEARQVERAGEVTGVTLYRGQGGDAIRPAPAQDEMPPARAEARSRSRFGSPSPFKARLRFPWRKIRAQ